MKLLSANSVKELKYIRILTSHELVPKRIETLLMRCIPQACSLESPFRCVLLFLILISPTIVDIQNSGTQSLGKPCDNAMAPR